MKKSQKIGIIAGIVLTIAGAAVAAPTIYFNTTGSGSDVVAQGFETPKSTATPESVHTKPVVSGHPNRITIPAVRINVPVVDGTFDTKKKEWTLGLSTAHWGTMTPLPNDTAGNTFIYGHYRPEVFAYLHNIQAGAEAYVDTDDGKRFVYTFLEAVDVSPADTSLFAYEGPSMLTVQTCSGTWFQNRTLYKFEFTRVESL
jgi:LPXTG-site transpeptidase (sortase) family protein